MLCSGEDPRNHANWPRFCEYASRVRRITITPFLSNNDTRLWEEIAALSEGTSILPYLARVEIIWSPDPLRWGAPHVPSGTIRVPLLSLSTRQAVVCGSIPDVIDPQSTLACLTAIHQCSPNVEMIVYEVEAIRQVMSRHTNVMTEAAGHFGNLRSFEFKRLVMEFDPIQLGPLANLPRLEHIGLETEAISRSDLPFTFKTLKSLYVKSRCGSVIGLLEDIRLPVLRHLSISLHRIWATVHDISVATKIIAARFPKLQALFLHASSSSPSGPVATGVGLQFLPVTAGRELPLVSLFPIAKPLLALRALRHITLDIDLEHITMEYTSDDLCALADAWPSLEDLRVEFPSRVGTRGEYAGVDTLVSFARGCPSLRELRLPTLTPISPEAAETQPTPVVHRTLEVLEVGPTWEGTPMPTSDEGRASEIFARELFPFAKRAFARWPFPHS